MMRWIKRIALGLGGLILAAVLVGLSYEQIMRWRAPRDFPAPGKLVDVDGSRMQIDCRGSGSPTVILESGLDMMGSLSWSAVHDAMATTTRTCAYSRRGIMWSAPSSGQFSADGIARDLHTLLANAGERAPFVMVGHSLGGPYVMTFTRLYPQDVAGLVFVDASHPEQTERINRAIGKKLDTGDSLLKFANAITWTGVPRLVMSHGDSGNIPPQAKAAQDAYISHSLASALQESEALDATFAAAGRLRNLEDRPLVVLTAGKQIPPDALKSLQLTVEQGRQIQTVWKGLHDEEASWSHHSRHEVVPDSTHYIQLDRPDVVIAAVREVVGNVRSGS
jgi:pimeloyl-ACP methyl ester carboxylesterase